VELAIRAAASGVGEAHPFVPWVAPAEGFGTTRGLCIVLTVRISPFSPETEQALVARAKQGDRAALGELLSQFGPTLFRSVLYPRLGNVTVAEQALGDTYARVVERIATFEWQNSGIYPWLRTVALHVAIDLLRARRREVLFEPEDLQREAEMSAPDDSAADPAQAWMERRDLEAARGKLELGLSRIHPRYASAIRLRVIEERTREEVAAALGVSSTTFDVILHRAMAALRKAIARASPETEEP
jgi:RNA polymerase sigma factor (sigma-70 family)